MVQIPIELTKIAELLVTLVVGFLGGGVFSAFIPSKKDKLDYQLKLFDIYINFWEKLQEYQPKLYNTLIGQPDKIKLIIDADHYFGIYNLICDAFLTNNIDKNVFNRVFLPKINFVKNMYEIYVNKLKEKDSQFQANINEDYPSIGMVLENQNHDTVNLKNHKN